MLPSDYGLGIAWQGSPNYGGLFTAGSIDQGQSVACDPILCEWYGYAIPASL
jgi:hypothetical protein